MRKLPDSNSDIGDDTEVSPIEDRPPGIPRWVMVSGIIVISLVLLFVLLEIIIGGDHGPGRHTPGKHGSRVEPAGQIEHEASGDQTPSGDHTTPGGGH